MGIAFDLPVVAAPRLNNLASLALLRHSGLNICYLFEYVHIAIHRSVCIKFNIEPFQNSQSDFSYTNKTFGYLLTNCACICEDHTKVINAGRISKY